MRYFYVERTEMDFPAFLGNERYASFNIFPGGQRKWNRFRRRKNCFPPPFFFPFANNALVFAVHLLSKEGWKGKGVSHICILIDGHVKALGGFACRPPSVGRQQPPPDCQACQCPPWEIEKKTERKGSTFANSGRTFSSSFIESWKQRPTKRRLAPVGNKRLFRPANIASRKKDEGKRRSITTIYGLSGSCLSKHAFSLMLTHLYVHIPT